MISRNPRPFVLAGILCLLLGGVSGCAKRCQPGTTLSGDKCLSNATLAQTADGGVSDAGDSDAASAQNDEMQKPRMSPDAGRAEADERASRASAAGSGGAAAMPVAGKMADASGAAVCGDGIVQGKELCDPASAAAPCPTSCEAELASKPCTEVVLAGSAATCDAECKPTTITSAVADDGCCPSGATPETDNDCAATCTSTAEVCDGRDNDCDGDVDEDVRNACGGCTSIAETMGSACTVGEGECQAMGTYECDGTDALRCSASARPERTETCDEKDNDCDGRVDEAVRNSCGGCARLDHERGEPCTAGAAACEGSGTYVCMGTDDIACDARGRSPTAEVCDGEDNDCDGVVDNGVGKTWYQDCDGDGYAVAGRGMDACSKPARTNGCDWVDREPTASATDCDDANETRHPGADFGLPISRTGQALPPIRDASYDLDCDGVLQTSGTLSTGLIKQGQLELIDFCEENDACLGTLPLCLPSFSVLGETTCGQPYRGQTACSGQINVYFLCR
jgi:hypothetical protein